jgi:ATP-dependent exoDNAse (exonuclease V) beta subunit
LLGLSSIGDPHDPFLMGGRIDLLVRDPTAPPHERWTIVDFKAGGHHPVKPKDNSREAATNELIREAKLRSYGTQLEAYREAVNDVLAAQKSDEAVGKTALWFVRKGSSVIW